MQLRCLLVLSFVVIQVRAARAWQVLLDSKDGVTEH